jgi:DNA-binding transcriptional MerR regulator
MSKTYSTGEVAKLIDVHRVTLQQWLISGKLKEPRRINMSGVSVRVWSERDLARARKYRAEHHAKGKGPKKGSKNQTASAGA